MKVLWLCNVITSAISKKLGREANVGGGWLEQVADMLDRREDVDLYVCAPFAEGEKLTRVEWGTGSIFYGFQKQDYRPWKYDASLENVFSSILEEIDPDIVHIFGTEFPHTLAMVKAFGNPARTVIHIQGLVSVYADYYTAYLPDNVIQRNSVRDFLRHDNIFNQCKKFRTRGKYEIEAIESVGHVMGRTDWDQAHCLHINPNIEYHYVQEVMRSDFYTEKWEYAKCRKHSIFMSQAYYPIKGLHLMLKALQQIVGKYPDTSLYIAGPDIVRIDDFQSYIRMSYYQKYIIHEIKRMHLENHVMFVGECDAAKMKEQYLKCNVFVSPSTIENSPNSVGEALLLGVPVVASDVGGVSSLYAHNKEGYIYRGDDIEMLSYYIIKVFESECAEMSSAAYNRAHVQYDPDIVLGQVMVEYEKIIGEDYF